MEERAGERRCVLIGSPLLDPLPTRSSQGEDVELDAALLHDLPIGARMPASASFRSVGMNSRTWASALRYSAGPVRRCMRSGERKRPMNGPFMARRHRRGPESILQPPCRGRWPPISWHGPNQKQLSSPFPRLSFLIHVKESGHG